MPFSHRRPNQHIHRKNIKNPTSLSKEELGVSEKTPTPKGTQNGNTIPNILPKKMGSTNSMDQTREGPLIIKETNLKSCKRPFPMISPSESSKKERNPSLKEIDSMDNRFALLLCSLYMCLKSSERKKKLRYLMWSHQ